MSDRRIFVDEEPSGGGNAGPWLVVALAAVVLAATTFVLADRQPAEDQTLVRLPPPSTTSTTSTTVPPSTTITQPAMILQRWVPGFDRTLHIVRFADRGLQVITWQPLAEPTSSELSIGSVTWAGFDADGSRLAATTVSSNGQGVLWTGTPEVLEPVRIGAEDLSAAFHATEPALLAISSAENGETQVVYVDVRETIDFERVDVVAIPGEHRVVAWSDEGLFLADLSDATVSWVTGDGRIEAMDGYFVASGAPLFAQLDRQRRWTTVDNEGIVQLPTGVRTISPSGRFLAVDALFEVELIDRATGLESDLPDGVGLAADWSLDERWLVYVSDIESYRRGVLTRLLVVDTSTGSVGSVALTTDQLPQPELLAIAP